MHGVRQAHEGAGRPIVDPGADLAVGRSDWSADARRDLREVCKRACSIRGSVTPQICERLFLPGATAVPPQALAIAWEVQWSPLFSLGSTCGVISPCKVVFSLWTPMSCLAPLPAQVLSSIEAQTTQARMHPRFRVKRKKPVPEIVLFGGLRRAAQHPGPPSSQLIDVR